MKDWIKAGVYYYSKNDPLTVPVSVKKPLNANDFDILAEHELIKSKQSNLTKMQRDFVEKEYLKLEKKNK